MTNIHDDIFEAMRVARDAAFNSSDQLSLGDLIDQCEAISAIGASRSDGSPPEVAFDFGYFHPVEIDSWRGSYAELALTYADENTAPMTLPAFIEKLRWADGETFTGYKGGEFTMSRRTPVWVANYGQSGNTAVIGVIDNGYQVIITTGWRDY